MSKNVEDMIRRYKKITLYPAKTRVLKFSSEKLEPDTVMIFFRRIGEVDTTPNPIRTIAIDLTSNYLGTITQEQLKEIIRDVLIPRPWLLVGFGSEIYAPNIKSAMEGFDEIEHHQIQSQVYIDHPWETNQDKMVKIMEELSRNVSLLTKDNASIHEHVKAKANGLEQSIVEALSSELGGTVVTVGYEYVRKMAAKVGDVDGIIEYKDEDGKQHIVICEVKTNVDKNYMTTVDQLSQNYERWKRYCKIPNSALEDNIGSVEQQEDEDGRLATPSKHDIKDAQSLCVRQFKDANISFAIGGDSFKDGTVALIEDELEIKNLEKFPIHYMRLNGSFYSRFTPDP